MLDVIKNNLPSVTGKNLRYIKLKTENVDRKNLDVYKVPYNEVLEQELWRLSTGQKILATRCGDLSTSLLK